MYRSKLLEELKDEKKESPSKNRLTFKQTPKKNPFKLNFDLLKTMGAAELRELLKQEKLKDYDKHISATVTRDVSHLKDKLRRNLSPVLPPLPSDIDHLKKLMESSVSLMSPAYTPINSGFKNGCMRENCLDIALDERLKKINKIRGTNSMSTLDFNIQPLTPNVDYLDRLDLGNPSGRQEVFILRE